MPGQRPDPTPIYRLVHVDNLPVCLSRAALHAPNHTPEDGLVYRTIHRQDIQEDRRVRELAVGPRGTIHDYVPFYFGPRSVMLYQLATGWVPGYREGQEPLIHLVSHCEAVAAAGIGFAFSDGHGLARFTAWYEDLAVRGMILGQGLRTILAGVAIGAVGSLALTRTVRSLLFGVSANDPLTFVAVTLVLVGAALLACYFPARRATRVDPVVALRCE